MTGIASDVFLGGTGRCLTDDIVLLDSLAYKSLRFCESCARDGFHSVLMQYPLFARCPVHSEDLVSRCPICGCSIDYAWPTQGLRAFRCRCSASLWVPQQMRAPRNVQRDECMKHLVSASSKWINQMIRPGTDGNAIRLWFTEHTVHQEHVGCERDALCIWAAFENAAARGRWCGQASTDGTMEHEMAAEEVVYLRTLSNIVHRIGLREETLLWWHLGDRGLDHKTPRTIAEASAFVAWRQFWEAETRIRLPTERNKIRAQASVTDLFARHFARQTLPGTRGGAKIEREVQLIVLSQVLWATFANACGLCRNRIGGAMSFEEIINTPMPAILIKEIRDGRHVVIWRHRAELSFGQEFFSSEGSDHGD